MDIYKAIITRQMKENINKKIRTILSYPLKCIATPLYFIIRKIEQRKNRKTQWSEEVAKKYIDIMLPRFVLANMSDDIDFITIIEDYHFDCSFKELFGYYGKKNRKEKKASIYLIRFSNYAINYIYEKYQIEGYTKHVCANINGWRKIEQTKEWVYRPDCKGIAWIKN